MHLSQNSKRAGLFMYRIMKPHALRTCVVQLTVARCVFRGAYKRTPDHGLRTHPQNNRSNRPKYAASGGFFAPRTAVKRRHSGA